jgi:predicted short-subunit dehydrogenase-like oxidoreductase (DUF2520 family)
MIEKVSILGAGKVAGALATSLRQAGISIEEIYCRTPEKAAALAQRVSARFVTDINQLSQNADLYIISVSDSAIEHIASAPALQGKFIVHTAGSVNMEVLRPFSNKIGIFYPLQTFSAGREIDMSVVPFCLEASSDEYFQALKVLAEKVSNAVYEVNSQQRKQLHLAAVFANNFGNHMVTLASLLLDKYQLPSHMLRPLVAETAAKLQSMTAVEAQTGPALRGDKKTMTEHLLMLQEMPLMQKIYTFVSESIEQEAMKTKIERNTSES